ncbi:MAG: ATP-binding protein [Bdellovibrio sp.]
MTGFDFKRHFGTHSLSLKLLIATWAISSFATLLLTAFQIYLDYQRDFEKLRNNFSIIQTSYLDSMSEHLWSYDTRLLKIQLEGLSRLDGIRYIRLTTDQAVLFETGSPDPTDKNHEDFKIVRKNNNQVLGYLTVEIDTQKLNEKYLNETLWIFVRQAAKTLIVVLCLYLVFNRILVVHIQHIASYLRNIQIRDKGDLKLHRRLQRQEDELDVLVQSINSFRSGLQNANEKLESVNQDLENKVQERTIQLTSKNESLEKAVQQIRKMQASLVNQERLASLGSLTSSVAHEIRNPLNFVLNFSELLTDSESLEEVHEISRVILKHSHRIDQIVRSMQILSGYDNDILEKTEINDVLKQAYQNTVSNRSLDASYVPPKVNYRLCEPTWIPSYRNSLVRAVSNIIDNAIHALEKKLINTEGFEPELTLSTAIRGDFLEISIRDNGVGIPTLLGEKIFDPFLTTKSAGEGAGLGLTVAFNIAQKHGGHLKYTSEFGSWSEFVLALPLAHERKNP